LQDFVLFQKCFALPAFAPFDVNKVYLMSAMSNIRRKRLWSKGKEGVYHISETGNKNDPFSNDLRTSKRSHDSVHINGNGFHGSLDSLAAEEDVWSLMADDDKSVKLLSSQRKGSLALDQILLDINPGGNNNIVEKPEKEVCADDDVKDIVAAIIGSRDSEGSETDSNSDSTPAVSDTSDVEEVSSDEESEPELNQDAFDIHAHINRLVKREYDSDSDSDSNGNESDSSEKAFKKAVQKVIRKVKRERSEEIADSDQESTQESEKDSETEESPSNEDSASEASNKEVDDDNSDASSTKSQKGNFEMERNVDPVLAELMEGGLVIDPKKGQHNGKESHSVYKYYLNKSGRINSVEETVHNENPPQKAECSPEETKVSSKQLVQKHEDNLATMLDDSKAQDLRWPYSNLYVKEFRQDPEETFSENGAALPSYRSVAASASQPGRKKNVMLGRVWWVEWWAMEDSRLKKNHSI